MFQNFEDIADPARGAAHVALIRRELRKRTLAGLLVPRADEHMNEYVPANAERLYWLTGFSGSAGLAAVMRRKAVLFVDGRYTLQAKAQVDGAVFEVVQTPPAKVSEWLAKALKKGDRLGYDPRLHSLCWIERLEKALGRTGARLVPLNGNPVDRHWKDRPPPPDAPVTPHPLKYAGVGAGDKIRQLQKDLRADKVDAAVLTLPESVAWLLNIRGGDVPHTPLPLAFAILHARRKPEFFIAPAKLSDNVRGHVAAVARVCAPDTLGKRLAALGTSRVLLDPETASAWFAAALKKAGAEIVRGPDPCLLPKAKKNAAEISGARTAHRRDGAAMCRFLAWLDSNAAGGSLDEIAAAKKLEAFRRETGALQEISFDTISGAGPNGAIVHYRVTRASNRKLRPGTLYLVDSGAQYRDGTTDVTRTVALGKPTAEMRRHFTLVLKGHIAIATARFPPSTRGADLDPLARQALWAAGLDYDHGTGHGVGSYLSVHERPARISRLGTAALEAGMIVSNEPGYYRAGEYGIRIENLVLVRKAENIRGGERAMMSFETLTLVPIDQRLLDPALLTPAELDWLNSYHARVEKMIAPGLGGAERRWLKRATAAVKP